MKCKRGVARTFEELKKGLDAMGKGGGDSESKERGRDEQGKRLKIPDSFARKKISLT
jgi:hypothetical protein